MNFIFFFFFDEREFHLIVFFHCLFLPFLTNTIVASDLDVTDLSHFYGVHYRIRIII